MTKKELQKRIEDLEMERHDFRALCISIGVTLTLLFLFYLLV